MRISDWSSDLFSSDLDAFSERPRNRPAGGALLIIADSESKRTAQFVGRHFGDDIERAARRVATRKYALWAAQHLYAFDVEQVLIARCGARDIDAVVMNRRAGVGCDTKRGSPNPANIDESHRIV